MKSYNIHDIFCVRTNVEGLFPEPFIQKGGIKSMTPAFIVERNPTIEFKLDDYVEINKGLYYSPTDKSVINTFRVLGNSVSTRYSINNNVAKLELSESYCKFSKLLKVPISGLYPVEHLVKIFTHVHLLNKGYGYLLSACLANGNSGSILITGMGGMGKTSTTLALMSNQKYKFLGDDTVILGKSGVYSFPRKLRIRRYGNPILSVNDNVDSLSLIDKNRIIPESTPRKIYFLERSELNDKISISKIEAIFRLETILSKIIPLTSERLLNGCYYSGILDYTKVVAIQHSLIEDLVSKLTEIYIVRTDDINKAVEIIDD